MKNEEDHQPGRYDEEIHAFTFPQALHGKKGINNASEILEVLRQVKVNIPLLDMIKQVSTYAKFLKDLCTIKRGLNVNKKAFLTEDVCEESFVGLEDRSVKILRGMIEDVLVQVEKNGLMQLKFGNMTLELNIFYLCKKQFHSEEEEGPEEGYLNPQICLLLCPLRRGGKKFCLYSMGRRHKKLYAYLEENKQSPVVISSSFITPQEDCLLEVLGDVVRAEVLKLLQANIIYPISDSPWDHFPLPFIDQVLERVSGHPFYCFLDGYSGYFQIEIDVEDQEKTIFTCPFGTYAYRRMSFGLCKHPQHSKDAC
ncbi:hypothetical protein CK203_041478 [Vitis vinifera]|uniref:Transposon Ty3-I Gag-Pol polyprotein n=1 Tax=Vitis vinifera TaxID=29760 RepID=A0A438HNF1_VITVI|nr:hypothetical protein CK203_041478 [Vitis vinifera]